MPTASTRHIEVLLSSTASHTSEAALQGNSTLSANGNTLAAVRPFPPPIIIAPTVDLPVHIHGEAHLHAFGRLTATGLVRRQLTDKERLEELELLLLVL